MADLKLISNVGWLYGNAGNGMVYAAKTPGGSHFLAVYFSNASILKWKYLPASHLQNYAAANQAGYASDLDLSKFTSQAIPDFVDDEDQSGGLYTLDAVINGSAVAKQWNGQNPYTVEIEGVTTAEINAVRTGTGLSSLTGTSSTTGTTGTNQTGTLGGLIPSSSEFSRLFSDPLGFVRTNIVFVAGVLVIVYYVRRKKKKPLWVI